MLTATTLLMAFSTLTYLLTPTIVKMVTGVDEDLDDEADIDLE